MPKRDYKQFCPAARALNIVGERWTLLIVRDLLISPRRYSELRRSLAGMASNLLAIRLVEMEDAGIIEKTRVEDPSPRDVYVLTDRGRELEPLLLELARFGIAFLDMPTDEQPLVAERVSLGLRALMHEPELPDDALTIHFALEEADYLVAIEAQGRRGERRLPAERVSVTPVDGGTSPRADVTARGTMAALLWIRQGVIDLASAQADDLLTITGADDAQQQLRFLYQLGDPAG